MKGVAIFSFLVVLVAVNAVYKKQTVTSNEIHQLMSKTIDSAYKSWKSTDPLELPQHTYESFILKSDDFDLTIKLSNMSIHTGDLVTKSVSARLNNSAVRGTFGFVLGGYKIVGKHETFGTVYRRNYSLNGDVELRHNYERKISFVASYDNKSVTLESFDRESHVSNASTILTGLPFVEFLQNQITSHLNCEFVRRKTANQGHFKYDFFIEYVIKYINEKIKGQTLQEVYDKCRGTAYEDMGSFRNIIHVDYI